MVATASWISQNGASALPVAPTHGAPASTYSAVVKQAPVASWHAPLEHCACSVHAVHRDEAASQIGVVPAQAPVASAVHCTHRPLSASQVGVAPETSAQSIASHATQVPCGPQYMVAPPHAGS